MPQIMTTKEVAEYLTLHKITICKYAAEGKLFRKLMVSNRSLKAQLLLNG